MSSTRVGTNKKYSDNWDNIFGGKRGPAVKSKSKSAKPAAKSAKKKAAKKVSPSKKTAARRKKRGK